MSKLEEIYRIQPYDLLNKRSPKLGFSIGATIEHDITNGFYLQSGLTFTTKGAKHKSHEYWIGGTNPPITYTKTTINQTYLQLPLMVAYKVQINQDMKAFLRIGAHVAYGIGGKTTEKEETKGADRPDETNKESSFGSEKLERFDFGLGSGIGFEYQRYVISLNYELGLRDISYKHDNLTNSDYKNRNASLTIGYKF